MKFKRGDIIAHKDGPWKDAKYTVSGFEFYHGVLEYVLTDMNGRQITEREAYVDLVFELRS